jgi:cyclopropane fatty-acyl-phospholipid synthase-like methyltransferase
MFIPNIVAYTILIILIPLIIFLSTFFILPFLVGAPYEGIREKPLKQMVKISNVKKSDTSVDLGSGDGRIVIAFAKKGIKAVGYEINPFLVLYSRRKIRKLKLQNKAKIYWKNFWNVDFGKYSIITTFQYFTVAKKLEDKINKECKKETKIISHYWKFPNLKIKKQVDKIYFYQK